MVETILSSPFFTEAVLPFLLIFTVLFAILQRTKILGDGKKQIDALVSLVAGLIVISFGYATGIIVTLIPFMAVAVVIILVFLILYGMVFVGSEFKLEKNLRLGIGLLAGIAVIIAALMATGGWDYIKDNWLIGADNNSILVNIIFIAVIVGAVVAVSWKGGESGGKDK